MISTNINKMREKLRAGDIVLGAGITTTDPTVTEAIAGSVDFVWIDLEHNAMTTESMLGHLIAARAGGVASIVRVPNNDVAWIKRVLDSGAEGIILPRSYSAKEVADFVSACRYPPLGTRGFGPRRPMQYGRMEQQAYLAQANRDIFVTAQVETVELLAEIDEVLKIAGLDSLVMGPQDLSGSMGRLGETTHPDVLNAIRTIAKKAKAAGKFLGSGLGANPQFAKTLIECGVQWMQAGNDFEYMIKGCDRTFREIRGGDA
ncbi:MAG: 4-hydroxy-3-methylbut-2-en-1-yl diphosphate synthase [Planctomycetaceae bacterium]|nr:4-hydroxy-3-methylbut-2-en-1-yl diphosphate synthase [Planctomycetaceae bacterium]